MKINPNLEPEQIVGIFALAGISITATFAWAIQTNRLNALKRENRINRFLHKSTERALFRTLLRMNPDEIPALLAEIQEEVNFEGIVLRNPNLDKKK